MGVDRQKERFVENPAAVRSGGSPSYNHALLWGVRGTGKSSLAKCGLHGGVAKTDARRPASWSRWTAANQVTALPALFDILRERPSGSWCSATTSPSRRVARRRPRRWKSALEGGAPWAAGRQGAVRRQFLEPAATWMPRSHSERGGHSEDRGLIATAEDAEESEVSVSDRFGLWIGFPPMDSADLSRRRPGLRQALPPWAEGRRPRPPGPAMGATARLPARAAVAWQFIPATWRGELGKSLSL